MFFTVILDFIKIKMYYIIIKSTMSAAVGSKPKPQTEK